MSVLIVVLLASAGFLGGFIDSIGGGGGLITLPALLAAGVPPQIALGTNKFQSMFGTSCALANFHRKAKVLWKIAALGIPFSLVGSVAGAKLALLLPPSILGKVLIVLLPPAVAFIFISKLLLQPAEPEARGGPLVWGATIAACASIGLYDGFFGPGTGTLLIVALVIFARIPLINASATAKTFNLASNVGAFVTFIVSGSIHYPAAIAMAAANIVGNYVGSHYAIKHGNELVQKIVAVSLTLLFVYLIWKYY